ncbi:DUF3775 domain-containing protein [Rhizobiales bacterium]|uniref:DUF3775 domain-containing protein n=1 Tax=Hongsoonwoonella zoysiae TaxID=2821844 RepID=UPI0015604D25|nr:DUF3775 domain-containing protein [Hongsoonwoonella zoysiae]NRG17695.1 DUF3775 domain-containing protein [Hongsoonwoonella zoysiae]
MAVDLSISPETVRMLINKARGAYSGVDESLEDGHDGEIEFDSDSLSDTHAHDGLAEEESEDLSEEELRELIEDLNVDEAAELVAICWVGRGDYDSGDFEQAIEDARERAVGPTAKYLLGMPLLADYLEAGLDTLDL